jgi:hypothetical protein
VFRYSIEWRLWCIEPMDISKQPRFALWAPVALCPPDERQLKSVITDENNDGPLHPDIED